jgi:hypothetical protein
MKLLLCCALLSLGVRAFALDPLATATAKFLAGMPVQGTPVERFSPDEAWARHATEFDRAWAKLEELQLAKIRVWGPQFLGDSYTSRSTMFYFFSGPDFLYANAFFPSAGTYILCGIEPVGAIPQLDRVPPAALASSLANLRKSLDSILSWSFFITKNMKVDLTQTQLTGTLPVLYVFLARAGCTIDSVDLVWLDRAGQFVAQAKGATPGVKIVFFGASGRQQTLYYFASDLSDSGIRSQPGFTKFCEQQAPGLSLLKAASYLLHEEGFSQARRFLLSHSSVILQDDSGIPHRFLADGNWLLRYCGHYAGPIDLFKQHPQPDLAHAFEISTPAPLEFGFGYQWQPHRSSLVIATPRLQRDE